MYSAAVDMMRMNNSNESDNGWCALCTWEVLVLALLVTIKA